MNNDSNQESGTIKFFLTAILAGLVLMIFIAPTSYGQKKSKVPPTPTPVPSAPPQKTTSCSDNEGPGNLLDWNLKYNNKGYCGEGCQAVCNIQSSGTQINLNTNSKNSSQDVNSPNTNGGCAGYWSCKPSDDTTKCQSNLKDFKAFYAERSRICAELAGGSADQDNDNYSNCMKGDTSFCTEGADKMMNDAYSKAYNSTEKESKDSENEDNSDLGEFNSGDNKKNSQVCPDDLMKQIKKDNEDFQKGRKSNSLSRCANVPVQDKMNAEMASLQSQNSDLEKRQDRYMDALKNQDNTKNQCTVKEQELMAQIQKDAQLQDAALAEERGQLSDAANVERDNLIALQGQIDQAKNDAAQINSVKVNEALTQYREAVSKAMTDCEHGLVVLGRQNGITFNNISDAMTASQVGVTSFKCQRDFDYQQMKAAALRGYNQSLRQDEIDFNTDENKIKQLLLQSDNLKRKLNTDDQKVVDIANAKIRAAEIDSQNANTLLMNLRQSCMSAMQRDMQQEGNAMAGVRTAAANERLAGCEVQYLQSQTGLRAQPSAKEQSKEGKLLEDAENDMKKLKFVASPCDSGATSNPFCCTDEDKKQAEEVRKTTK